MSPGPKSFSSQLDRRAPGASPPASALASIGRRSRPKVCDEWAGKSFRSDKMTDRWSRLWPGAPLAIVSAILFGASAPLAKALLATLRPQMLAGLLYLGAGAGLAAILGLRAASGRTSAEAPLRRRDWPWLAAVVLFGGVAGPLLLMLGLARASAASGSLLLNLEGLATMLIAWTAFRENVDTRLMIGAFAMLAGTAVLSWSGEGARFDAGAAFIVAACVAWGIDNNLTRKLSSADPVMTASVKGLTAGGVNIALAIVLGASRPSLAIVGAALLAGFLGIGASLVCYMLALRHLGAARTGAYFSLAPFIGAAIAVALLGEPVTAQLALAGLLMGVGLWLHLTERHEHEHAHETFEHEHVHVHDEHHGHRHDGSVSEPHSHRHSHAALWHSHAHYPDLHHRHPHG
jgi:drug/metabolite transporter (DMT)-like permease